MKRKYLALFPLVGLVLSGCSIQDLMFWKKNKGGEQEQKQQSNFNK